jgi:hypothetical protein
LSELEYTGVVETIGGARQPLRGADLTESPADAPRTFPFSDTSGAG